MYFDLLKAALDTPHVYNPTATRTDRTDDQVQEYEIYAFMVWNFLEAVFDRCEHDKALCTTWYPAIEAETRRHRKWFDKPENEHRFKVPFREFIQRAEFTQPREIIRILELAESGMLTDQDKSVAPIAIVTGLVDSGYLDAILWTVFPTKQCE
ncbi:MAG: hypothetical protein ACREXS_19820 [Gammaproteobacteria bacterium]